LWRGRPRPRVPSISTAPRDRAPSRAWEKSNWDGTDVSADLSSEALGEGGSLGEGGGRPSLKNDIDFGGLQSLAAAETNNAPNIVIFGLN
jgi:hypothetical protein